MSTPAERRPKQRGRRLHSLRCCALHQEIPEEKLSRVSAYDWFGSVAMVPVATALAGPAEAAFGRAPSLWGCAALVAVSTAAVLLVPDVRRLTRRPADAGKASVPEPVSADAERSAGRLG